MRIRAALFLLIAFQAGSAPGAETIEDLLSDVDRLVAEKKYLSAFEALNNYEDGNSYPDIALKKADLAMNYFASSIMHITFAFRDLEEWEDILKVRGSVGRFTMHTFNVEEVFKPLIEKYPEDSRLCRTLADYYIDVYEKYRGQWIKSDKELLEGARENYGKAISLGDSDAKTYFRAGKAALYLNDPAGAAQKFEAAVDKSGDYAPARYNLAYAYLFMDRQAEAAAQAVEAYNLYTEIPLKADAAMLAGQAYLELGKTEESLKYFLLCDEIAPDKYENMRRLMGLYVRLGRGADAKAIGDRIFEMDPKNPTASRAFLESYGGTPLQGKLPDIFRGLAAKYAADPEAAGNALFHLSVFYLQSGEKSLALETIDEAEKDFRKSLKEDHAVFQAIAQIRQSAGQKSPKQ